MKKPRASVAFSLVAQLLAGGKALGRSGEGLMRGAYSDYRYFISNICRARLMARFSRRW